MRSPFWFLQFPTQSQEHVLELKVPRDPQLVASIVQIHSPHPQNSLLLQFREEETQESVSETQIVERI